jgi:hypothetical protein
LRSKHSIRSVIRSRSRSRVASISGVASSNTSVRGPVRHGRICLMIRVGSPAASRPRICRTRSTRASS